MKKINLLISSISILILISISGCSGNKTPKKSESTSVQTASETQPMEVKNPVVIGKETSLLLKDLVDNGDYVNSKDFPSLIKASIVKESLDKNILVIDIRTPKLFSDGHIKGSVNKKFEDLPAYFETGIKPFTFDKIILVCNGGQQSSYATSLLRLMGYGNVYSMRWGMSAWNLKYAKEGWLKDVSGKYEANLETITNEKSASNEMPELKTGMTTGAEIGEARFHQLFKEGTANIVITADEVFSNPQKYYIINFERKDKYDDGHIPGAVRYKPEATLGFIDEMASIPKDKSIVVYCGTGHNSGFATAYLRLFGYDARTLRYGNNSFMYDKMIKERTALSWMPFTTAEVNNFDVVK
jgi:rhodanese-related sulfurtransferase